MKLVVDGQPIEFQAGDSLLVALLRAGLQPTGGGCLCLGGDCPHCLATVDGVSYVRTCQVAAQPGLVVERHPASGYPPLPSVDRLGPETPARNLHCDVVVIGAGPAGLAAAAEAAVAGKQVITLEATEGQEAVGVYPGPLVVARTAEGMWHLHVREEVIVATGAAELQPVAPGAHLAGLVTARAASQLARAGLDLGHVVAVGTPPEGVAVAVVSGELVRFEGESRVEAVVVRDAAGTEQ
ncbi:MAG TPA: 2Fe-2S iron-sulfur cluster-binding protein, partial [Anaerolineae bacterium]|nr:2Fe-2S iron-sulfur cluster-binding protein [Anaerolineae bacterium]